MIRVCAIGATIVLLGACVVCNKDLSSNNEPISCRSRLSLSMVAHNAMGPFVNEEFALRLGFLVISEKYPKNIFTAREPGVVADRGDVWLVTFENAVVGDMRLPARLGITIRKVNGEIIDLPAAMQ